MTNFDKSIVITVFICKKKKKKKDRKEKKKVSSPPSTLGEFLTMTQDKAQAHTRLDTWVE